MATVVWTTLTIAGMVAMFGACVILVVGGVRVLENALGKNRNKPSP